MTNSFGSVVLPRVLATVIIAFAAAPGVAGAAEGDEAPQTFTVGGQIQTYTGLFIANDKNQVDAEGFPTSHGGKEGKISIFRNTLRLDANWAPYEGFNLHAIILGVRSAMLDADRYAQVPEFTADLKYNDNATVVDAKKRWASERYYNYLDLRELYADIDVTKRLSLRVGRQQVTWGETGNYRLLDVINPTDNTWHLSPFESFEDQRIPLWIFKALYDIPALEGSLEFVWVPALDGDKMVTVPLTFVGAWGLPLGPKNLFVSDIRINQKYFLYPDRPFEDSRLGVRWKGVIGQFTYTLLYYWGHQISPPVPYYASQEKATRPDGYHYTDVYLNFPRQHIAGLSLEYAFNYPVGTVVRLESSVEPNRTYPVNSYLGPGYLPDGSGRWYQDPDRPDYLRADFHQDERLTVSYAVVLQQPLIIRFLNPTSSFILQLQAMQTVVPEGGYVKDPKTGETNYNWFILGIPGYDTTKVSAYSTTFVGALLTNYLHGLLSPMIVSAYDITYKSGFTRVELRILPGDHWRFSVALAEIYGQDPYKGLGLFRDRDEVTLKAAYQF
ncbi:MAG: hypothetical protein HY897_23635 [Deltaproteobacteria bacterium]|nr:hypothetical protein [Deltaproteobacteria bacterium]